MRHTLAVVILAFASPAIAGEAVTVERAAADIPRVVEAARKDAAAQPAPAAFNAAQVTDIWVQTDCKTFTFAENSPARSEPLDFRSETWLEECINIPLPNPPGGGTCIPQRRMMSADIRTVTVQIKDRPIPGPQEAFEVCLWGSSLSLKVKKSPNKYAVREEGEPVFNSTLVLTKK